MSHGSVMMSGTVSYLRSPEQNLRLGGNKEIFLSVSSSTPDILNSSLQILIAAFSSVHLISTGAAIDTVFQFQLLFEFSATAADF